MVFRLACCFLVIVDYFPDAFVVLASLIEPEVTSDLCNTLWEKDFNFRIFIEKESKM